MSKKSHNQMSKTEATARLVQNTIELLGYRIGDDDGVIDSYGLGDLEACAVLCFKSTAQLYSERFHMVAAVLFQIDITEKAMIAADTMFPEDHLIARVKKLQARWEKVAVDFNQTIEKP